MTQDIDPDYVAVLMRSEAAPAIRAFKATLEDALTSFPELAPISWIRDPWKNANTPNADPYSLHLLGLAADLDYAGADLNYFKRVAGALAARGLSSVIYWQPTRKAIHVQALPGPTAPPPTAPLALPVGGLGAAGMLEMIRKILTAVGLRQRADEPTVIIKT